jgi:hypothetical protein
LGDGRKLYRFKKLLGLGKIVYIGFLSRLKKPIYTIPFYVQSKSGELFEPSNFKDDLRASIAYPSEKVPR